MGLIAITYFPMYYFLWALLIYFNVNNWQLSPTLTPIYEYIVILVTVLIMLFCFFYLVGGMTTDDLASLSHCYGIFVFLSFLGFWVSVFEHLRRSNIMKWKDIDIHTPNQYPKFRVNPTKHVLKYVWVGVRANIWSLNLGQKRDVRNLIQNF